MKKTNHNHSGKKMLLGFQPYDRLSPVFQKLLQPVPGPVAIAERWRLPERFSAGEVGVQLLVVKSTIVIHFPANQSQPEGGKQLLTRSCYLTSLQVQIAKQRKSAKTWCTKAVSPRIKEDNSFFIVTLITYKSYKSFLCNKTIPVTAATPRHTDHILASRDS
jgi:hypothetical protein